MDGCTSQPVHGPLLRSVNTTFSQGKQLFMPSVPLTITSNCCVVWWCAGLQQLPMPQMLGAPMAGSHRQ
jgi:hypothetical protein